MNNENSLNSVVAEVTGRIVERSRRARARYLKTTLDAQHVGPHRTALSCGNLAHGFAACGSEGKEALSGASRGNLGIVSSYNDMLSAHQPFKEYPALLKEAAWQAGGVAQFAGGVPAMCDGVTQGQPGMELSLFSRDVIAMSTAVSLTHNMFDAVACLGVCDKIVPGLLIGALTFGHLPVIFVPAGPMTTGISNSEKAQVRQLYAEGKIDRAALLKSESKAYHSPGTCTFYGTANSNQLLMEFMGLHLPGTSFVNPGTPLRDALTKEAARRALTITQLSEEYTPIAQVIDERAIVNGLVGLLASGGSTNHTLHLVAIARAAGIIINWDDFDELSSVVPLLARVYPNGKADVNHFQAAGGIQFLIRGLLKAGLLHNDVTTVAGPGLENYTKEPYLDEGELKWREGTLHSLDEEVVRDSSNPFDVSGGLKLLTGNLGRAVIKISAVKQEHHKVSAPARVFSDQDSVAAAFKNGELNRDVIVVLKQQGPRANGMPELHKLTPLLGVLQDQGHSVALVTDGRMSGASGKVPAAIQITPEACAGGLLALVRDDDMIHFDATTGELQLDVSEAKLANREPVLDVVDSEHGFGRELFSQFRQMAGSAEEGGGPAVFDDSVHQADAVELHANATTNV
ncbi:MAG: phosphogluconate dehydratase [Gammaproteobacteria bacterium]